MRVLKACAARRIFRRAFVSRKKVYKTDGRRGGVFEGTCRSGRRKNSAAKRLTKQKKRYTMICDLNRKVRLTVKG